MVDVYIEEHVGAHIDDATVAWLFDLPSWGVCGQGHDEVSALEALRENTGTQPRTMGVVERIAGDERAFRRDRRPATNEERKRTLGVLDIVRPQTIALVASASENELDFVDPERKLPSWARWHTLRQMGWHIADTESRYYLAQLGVSRARREPDLLAELHRSHDYVRVQVMRLPADSYHQTERGEEWTTVKVLRRLAWHERSELVTMRRLLERARAALAART